jgi:hypothetical protein
MKSTLRLALAAAFALLAGCGRDAPVAPAAPAAEPAPAAAPATDNTLRPDEWGAAPVDATGEAPTLPPVEASDPRAGKARFKVVSERGYANPRGEFMADVLERDVVYFSAQLETPEGNPVRGARPEVLIEGKSTRVPLPIAIGEAGSVVTDDTGTIEFGVRGGVMGEDLIRVRHGKAEALIRLNVISLRAAGYAPLLQVKGAVEWDRLMQAELRYDETSVTARFPPDIAALDGKLVKLVGFVLPLEASEKQQHFLLTSNPPSCFFHIPGGAAGAVEVFATKGIAVVDDPVVLEGRFQALGSSTEGVVYRLRDARLLRP